jgi:hypothetical protein
MAWLEAALAIVVGFFKSIPIFDRWFTKSPTEKIIDRQEDNKKKAEQRKKTGRG